MIIKAYWDWILWKLNIEKKNVKIDNLIQISKFCSSVDGIITSLRFVFECKIVISLWNDHYLRCSDLLGYIFVKKAILRFSFKIHFIVVALYKNSLALQLCSLVQKLYFSDKELRFVLITCLRKLFSKLKLLLLQHNLNKNKIPLNTSL